MKSTVLVSILCIPNIKTDVQNIRLFLFRFGKKWLFRHVPAVVVFVSGRIKLYNSAFVRL